MTHASGIIDLWGYINNDDSQSQCFCFKNKPYYIVDI